MTRALTLALAVPLTIAVASAAARPGGSPDRGKTILQFDSMSTVTEPFTGATEPVRGLSGGGLPWQIDRARGELRSDGRLKTAVHGLVLASRAPVPPEMQGTNPVA